MHKQRTPQQQLHANGSILQKIGNSSISATDSITVKFTNNTINVSINKAKVSLGTIKNPIITL